MSTQEVLDSIRHSWQAHVRRYIFIVALAFVLSLGAGGTAAALTSSSAHYKVTETQFGVGSSLQNCSSGYCAKTSVGDTTVGMAHSADYSAVFGFNTSDQPLLEVISEPVNQNMGTLGPSVTGTAVQSIKVRTYLSKGYVLEIAGPPPGQGTYNLAALSTPTASKQGDEQFGINLAANTAPSIGSDPVQVPNSTDSFGTVATNYKNPNLFMYSNGDTIAQSLSSTGQTDYTLSLIINVSNTTPGGQYSGQFSAVVVPVY